MCSCNDFLSLLNGLLAFRVLSYTIKMQPQSADRWHICTFFGPTPASGNSGTHGPEHTKSESRPPPTPPQRNPFRFNLTFKLNVLYCRGARGVCLRGGRGKSALDKRDLAAPGILIFTSLNP